MALLATTSYPEYLSEVISAFGLGSASDVLPLGGTATLKFAIQTPEGRFVVRARPSEFADPKLIRFDHQALWRLAEHGLPVPRPCRRPNGTSWVQAGDHVFEVLSWLDGDPFQPGDRATIHGLGDFLARFHLILSDNIPPGKEGLLREDHPDLLLPYVTQLRELCQAPSEKAQLERLAQQLELVREHLDRHLYPRLPRAVIHGDIHPGNVKFSNGQVAAVYDFDYLNEQARCRDLVDALMFFGSERALPLDVDNIRSLTQPFRPNAQWAAWLLEGYQLVSRLSELEWEALPWLMRSQWLQIRLRGSRKVPREEKLGFVLNGFFEVIDWLDHEVTAFFRALQSHSSRTI